MGEGDRGERGWRARGRGGGGGAGGRGAGENVTSDTYLRLASVRLRLPRTVGATSSLISLSAPLPGSRVWLPVFALRYR